MEHLSESLGALFVESGMDALGARGSRHEGEKAAIVEGVDAFLTVWEPHPRLQAISGGDSPRELARRIWHRRITKASLERSPASKASRSSCDNERTKIGGFMHITIAHNTPPSLKVH